MHVSRLTLQIREHPTSQPDSRSPVLVVSQQSGAAIRRRREIREALHDSQALTIEAKDTGAEVLFVKDKTS